LGSIIFYNIYVFFEEKKHIIIDMRYDKKGLPVKEYYTKDKMKAIRHQKYYTGGSIILMFIVLIGMYFVLY